MSTSWIEGLLFLNQEIASSTALFFSAGDRIVAGRGVPAKFANALMQGSSRSL
jgi:hypothetical protein